MSGTAPPAWSGERLIRAALLGTATLSALLVCLAGCGAAASSHVAARPTATPAQDPVTVAYVNQWRDGYAEVVRTNKPVAQCFVQVTQSGGSVSVMNACQGADAAQLAGAQALKVQLAAITPPARWQSQHAALQQAVQGVVDINTEMLASIAAQDPIRYLAVRDMAHRNIPLFCAPIQQLNAGPPLLVPSLDLVDRTLC